MKVSPPEKRTIRTKKPAEQAAACAAVLLLCFCFVFSSLADTIADSPDLSGGTTAASASSGAAQVPGPPGAAQTGAQTEAQTGQSAGSGSSASGSSVSDHPVIGEPEGQTAPENESAGGAGTGTLVPGSAPEPEAEESLPAASSAAAGSAESRATETGRPVLETEDHPAAASSAASSAASESTAAAAGTEETGSSASGSGQTTAADAGTGSREIPAGPVTGTDTVSSSAAPQPGASAAAGSVHANDAVSRVWLDFFLISPNHVKGSLKVTKAALQLSDGSWQEIGYSETIRYPFYRMLSQQTGSDGRSWYITAAHARRFGDTCSEDGEMKTELWLDASDCISRNYIDINTTNATRIAIVKAALALLGKQYTYGGTGPDAFDCSGFVQYVMREAGVTVPRTSTELLDLDGQITAAELRPGDILARAGHCGIYIGNGIFVHASDSSVGVVAEYLSVYNQTNKFTSCINAVGD